METLFLVTSLVIFISLLLYFIPRFCVPKLEPPPLKRCRACHALAVELTVINYSCQVLKDGELNWYHIEGLRIPICRDCGRKSFTVEVDNQVEAEIERQQAQNVK